MGNTTPDRVIAAIASCQHSLATHQQLLAAGVSESCIDHRVGTGRLLVVHRGVYAIAGVRPYFEQRVMAACLATSGFASHRAAAALYRLRGFTGQSVEVSVDRGHAPELPGVTCHRSKDLPTTTIGLIPVTTPAQTLLDICGVAPRLAEGALADAVARRMVTIPQLVRFLKDRSRPGRPGGRRLRQLVEPYVAGQNPTESWLEDRLVEFLRQHGLPEPVRQHRVWLPDRSHPIRLDCAYPDRMVDLEADSRLWHLSPAQQQADAERDRAVSALGWRVLRITWLAMNETPHALAAQIRDLLRGRCAA